MKVQFECKNCKIQIEVYRYQETLDSFPRLCILCDPTFSPKASAPRNEKQKEALRKQGIDPATLK